MRRRTASSFRRCVTSVTMAKEPTKARFIQVDISPIEPDSNVATAAPVIGDIGSCMAALNGAIGAGWRKPPSDWTSAIAERKDKNLTKMSENLAKETSPMTFQTALSVIRDKIRERPDAILVNEGANTLDFCRSIVDMHHGTVTVSSRLGVGTTFVVTLPRDPRVAEGPSVDEAGPTVVADSSPAGRTALNKGASPSDALTPTNPV